MEKLKTLLGITDASRDELLKLILDEVEEFILSYCRIDAIPDKLKNTIPFMAADLYRYKGYGASSLPTEVKSISQGNRSVTYDTDSRPDEVFKEYYKRLNPYRRARVPSEVSANEQSV